ncbi:MAG TPA: STAS domain-containing protein [Acidimicrobiia bacterium]
MTADEELSEELVGPVPVVHIDGEVDISNWLRVATAITDATEREGPGLVVDLRRTRYLDSSGVRLLFEARRRLQADDRPLVLVTVIGTPAESVLRHTGLLDVVPTVTTVDEAVALLVQTSHGDLRT